MTFFHVLTLAAEITVPYPDLSAGTVAAQVSSRQLKPIAPQWTDPQLKQMLDKCFEYEPEKRISFREILDLNLTAVGQPPTTTSIQEQQSGQQPNSINSSKINQSKLNNDFEYETTTNANKSTYENVQQTKQ